MKGSNMADDFDEKFMQDEKENLLERLRQADVNDEVLVDECLLNELWPASKEEIEMYPYIKFSHGSIRQWCTEEGVEGWRPRATERTESEHHNDSPDENYFRPMAFEYSKKLRR